MKIPEEETLWVTNLKKGLVDTFNMHPLRKQLTLIKKGLFKNYFPANSYVVQEPTVFGVCESQYTEYPAQSESGMKGYTLIRSINFDTCNDRVAIQVSL